MAVSHFGIKVVAQRRVAYIIAGNDVRLAGSQRKREWGWGLEFVSDADQCLCFLFSEGTKEERKDRQAMRDEYINTEWLKKKEPRVVGSRKIFSPPLGPEYCNVSGPSFIRGMAGRWCGRSLPCKCGLGWRLLYGARQK